MAKGHEQSLTTGEAKPFRNWDFLEIKTWNSWKIEFVP